MTTSLGIDVRRATVADAAVIARHRAGMFRDMGKLPDALHADLLRQVTPVIARLIEGGDYVGWLATPAGEPATVVGGAGVHLRRIIPRPILEPNGQWRLGDREAVVVNVFTEAEWRRRGVASLLMSAVVDWARETALDVLVLHASDDGRALYERIGFVDTNEMRFAGGLR